MPVVTATRQASVDEIANEMDRRGRVIEKLEAELIRLRPFSYYPEAHKELVKLSRRIQESKYIEDREVAASQLADMVIAIIEDERFHTQSTVVDDGKVVEKDDGPTAA